MNQLLLNEIDDIALSDINYTQYLINMAEENINELKAELGKAGYKVKMLDRHPAKDSIFVCIISEKNKQNNNFTIETRARCSEDDFNIPTFGKYLALARAAKILIGGK